MNKKELAEIRRRFRAEHCNIGHIYGCYVNSNKEIISDLDISLGMLARDEAEMYVNLLKKAISGTLDKNLLNIAYSPRQVMNSQEHALLMELRKTHLRDEEVRKAFFRKVIDSADLGESNFVIFLAEDSYDVAFKNKSGDVEDDSHVFQYFVCSVCPVKEPVSSLCFVADENIFHSCSVGRSIAAPEIGFMFPSFDSRTANIYNALFYTRDAASVHREFVDTVFHVDPPMTSVEQNETFCGVLERSLEEDCSLEVVQSVHEQIASRIAEHKESRSPEKLILAADDVGRMLQESGVSEEKIEAFCAGCDQEFGEGAALNPSNIVDNRHFEISTEEVSISVKPEFSGFIKTRVIDGCKYILIPADGEVCVNGVPVSIAQENAVENIE